jgi:pyruvate/2-oxoacid:ferredoxin oxidoreductase alpha subunit
MDTAIQAYRIAEKVCIPVMLCYDGYILSHTVMPVDVPSQEAVDKFLPQYRPHTILDSGDPRNLNQVTLADPRMNAAGELCHGYMEFRYMLEQSIEAASATIAEVDAEFEQAFGRSWGGIIWKDRADDAEVLMVAAGSLGSEATVAADQLRAAGIRAGVVGIRSYRPFPKREVSDALKNARFVAVFDKSLSYGNEGPISADVKAAMYGIAGGPVIKGYVGGLGGRDIKARELAEVVRRDMPHAVAGSLDTHTGWINCQY